jgi:hypothetical protein
MPDDDAEQKKSATMSAGPANATTKDSPPEVDEWGLPVRNINPAPTEEIAESSATPKEPPQSAGKKPSASPELRTDDAHNADPVLASKPESDSTATIAMVTKKEEPAKEPDAPKPSAAPSNAPSDSTPSKTSNADPGNRDRSNTNSSVRSGPKPGHSSVASEWSHQQLAQQEEVVKEEEEEEDKWETMPAYAPFDIYDDDGKLVAKEAAPEADEEDMTYAALGGAGKGYTRVQMDEDAQSATSMDENTAYLFKEPSTNLLEEDEESRDVVAQMQTTKTILTEGQRIAYVGLVRLAMMEMLNDLSRMEKTKGAKKTLDFAIENTKMWSQKIMVSIYKHQEIESAGNVPLPGQDEQC